MMTAIELPKRQEWTVDDLVDLPPDLNYELINGRLVLPSPTPAHQDLSVDLLLALRVNCPPEYVVTLDLSLEIDPRNEPRPDVVAIRAEHYNRSPVPVQDAILAIEVGSPGSMFRDLFDKSTVYAKAGIANYWIVDEEEETHALLLTEMVLNSETGFYRTGRSTSEVFSVKVPWEITVDLPELSRRRAAIRGRAKPAE